MEHTATIIIPDISGFTNFVTKTDLTFSTDTLCELLNEILSVADVTLTVSEIEGDAILFYKKDEKIPMLKIVEFCLNSFSHFHEYLKIVLERISDKVVYEAVSQLTLKYIVHFGKIAEMNIVNFKKPVGVDLIKAHRLLKNNIPGNEYILVTHDYAQSLDIEGCKIVSGNTLVWLEGEEEYQHLGKINFHYAMLHPFRNKIVCS